MGGIIEPLSNTKLHRGNMLSKNSNTAYLPVFLSLILIGSLAEKTIGQEPFNPKGHYELTTNVLGFEEPVQFDLEVTPIEHGYAANVTSEIAPDISRTVPVEVTGRELHYETVTPNGTLAITISVAEDNSVKGTWNLGLFLRGTLDGRKLAEESSDS
tara:strand:+ start:162 stop:632 length:471 start_codon:yes stop_codon:yes gene_type:complete